jgi:hypothetical protein
VGGRANTCGQTDGHDETNGRFSRLNAVMHSSVTQLQPVRYKLPIPLHPSVILCLTVSVTFDVLVEFKAIAAKFLSAPLVVNVLCRAFSPIWLRKLTEAVMSLPCIPHVCSSKLSRATENSDCLPHQSDPINHPPSSYNSAGHSMIYWQCL